MTKESFRHDLADFNRTCSTEQAKDKLLDVVEERVRKRFPDHPMSSIIVSSAEWAVENLPAEECRVFAFIFSKMTTPKMDSFSGGRAYFEIINELWDYLNNASWGHIDWDSDESYQRIRDTYISLMDEFVYRKDTLRPLSPADKLAKEQAEAEQAERLKQARIERERQAEQARIERERQAEQARIEREAEEKEFARLKEIMPILELIKPQLNSFVNEFIKDISSLSYEDLTLLLLAIKKTPNPLFALRAGSPCISK